MKLNKLKNVELVRKGIYSQELHHYTSLCKIYESLLKSDSSNPRKISDLDIEKTLAKYEPFLDAASKGDYSYLDTHHLSPDEIESFKKFAYHSQKLDHFKQADALLKQSIDVDAVTRKNNSFFFSLRKF